MRCKSIKHGDIRKKSGFLFRPKEIDDEIRWLEFAKWEQKYWYIHVHHGITKDGWVDERWLD